VDLQGSPRPIRLYVVALAAAGLVALAFVSLTPLAVWPRPLDLAPEHLLALLALLVAAVVAESNPIPLPTRGGHDESGMEMSISTAIYVAAMLLVGPALGSMVAALTSIVTDWRARKPAVKVLFNAAQLVLTISITGAIYWLVTSSPRRFDDPYHVAWLGIALALHLALNTGLVSIAVALAEGLGPWEVWNTTNRRTLPQYVGMQSVGVVGFLLWTTTPWTVLLLALPAVTIYLAFKLVAQLRVETWRALAALADAVDKRDSYTFTHSQDVGRYAELVARRMNLPLEEQDLVCLAGRLHDLGKISVPDSILLKAGPLTDDERSVMNQHPTIGADILRYFSLFERGAALVEHHHEDYNGSGYPRGLRGEEIPLGARIIHVCDAYQAMTSARPYRGPMPAQAAVERLLAASGSMFDPVVVAHFLKVLEEIGEWTPPASAEANLGEQAPAPRLLRLVKQ